jgi:uncharacterized protein YodC (DUF2158 family)
MGDHAEDSIGYCLDRWFNSIDCENWENSQYNYSNKKKKEPKQVRKFKVGDSVRLKNGTAEIRVTYISGTYLSGEYVKSSTYVTYRHQDAFVHFTKDDNQKEKTMSTNTLYQFTVNVNAFAPTQCFGTHIGTNSQGQWIMEVKGTGQIVAVDKKDVEEVLPYSLGVKFLNGNGTVYNYLADKDKYDLGFYLMKDKMGETVIVQVVSLDTKSKIAKVDFKPIGKLAVDMY